MYRAHCSLVDTVQPCKYNIGAILGTLKFQSLIGTVQQRETIETHSLDALFQSLIGTVQRQN